MNYTATRVGCLVLVLAACGGSSGPSVPQPAGIGTAPREAGSDAIQSVEPDENQFVSSVEEMLQGKVAGLQVLDLPGCGVTLRIRGLDPSLRSLGESGGAVSECEREPLLIIDDKPVALGNLGSALRSLLPQDIDRIRVLKDVASTAVYGTRGAHGVVIITTK